MDDVPVGVRCRRVQVVGVDCVGAVAHVSNTCSAGLVVVASSKTGGKSSQGKRLTFEIKYVIIIAYSL